MRAASAAGEGIWRRALCLPRFTEGRTFFGEHTRYKNLLCCDLEVEPAVQLGKLRAELAQNGHGFPPCAHRSRKSGTASFQKPCEPEGLIFETQLLRLQVGLFVAVSESTQASRCPAEPLLRWQQDGFVQPAKLGMEKMTHPPPAFIF